MGDSAHTTHHTNPGKKSAPPLFLGDENFFQKSATLVQSKIESWIVPTWPIFEKSSHLREKGGVLIFSRVFMVGCMGRISHTNLKKRMVISRIATSKNHIELLVPGQI